MKILLLGKNGQLGCELQRALAPLGELIAVDRHSEGCNLLYPQKIAETVQSLKPDVVVNAAGYTAVDKAETEIATTRLINAEAPAALAKSCATIGALLIHYSTDYVFDGSGSTPWLESNLALPLNVYGLTKLEGEEAIVNSGCRFLIFRTSWIYSRRGNNFVKTILRLAQERTTLSVVSDQIGAPTGAELLAEVTVRALSATQKNQDLCGLYHVAAEGEVSWYDYAHFIVARAKERGLSFLLSEIIPLASEAYQTEAKRPLNSRLNCMKATQSFSLHLEPWKNGVVRVIDEISGFRK